MANDSLKIGFIGLGALGQGLCSSLVRAGFSTTVTDLNQEAAQPLVAAGAAWSADVAGVCRGADVVITALPSPAVSRKVVEGPGGVFENMAPGGVWIEMSTTDFEDLQRLQSEATLRGISVLECPVTGGVHLANSGEITVLVGGEEGVYRRDATYRAIRASSGNSFVHETESKLILSGSYNVKFTMDLACKDLGLVNNIAEKIGVPLELGSMTQQIFMRARGLYGGNAQSPEVARMIEAACGLELRAPGYPAELLAEEGAPRPSGTQAKS